MKKDNIKKKNRYISIFVLILLALLITGAGCGTIKIHDILDNPEKYLGKEVLVQGKVTNTVKIGSISGFTLVDGEDKIIVSSKELPAENKTVTVKGTVMKEILIGYYIYATEIR